MPRKAKRTLEDKDPPKQPTIEDNSKKENGPTTKILPASNLLNHRSIIKTGRDALERVIIQDEQSKELTNMTISSCFCGRKTKANPEELRRAFDLD